MSALPSNGASRLTPVSLVESMFDEHFEATTTCCAGADARPVSTLATRLHEVCQAAGLLAEVAEDLHRLDAVGASLDPAKLSGMCNMSQEIADQLQSIRASVASRPRGCPLATGGRAAGASPQT